MFFPSAITAEGAAADFNRVPFYRKIAAVKIVDIKFKKYYRPKSGLCQPMSFFAASETFETN